MRSDNSKNSLLIRLAGIVALAALAAGLGVWFLAGKSAPVNVILITLDTTRADHLPAYGYEKVETPYLDRLIADGVLFERAASHVPLTLPSHTSIMTGTYPFFHGVRNNGDHYASDAINTAAEIYKAAGYDTAAFVGSFVLDSRFGLDQGFDTYDDDMVDGRQKHSLFEFKDRIAENIINRVLTWLEKRLTSKAENPFFLWVHLFDPHKEYLPPEPFKSKYPENPYDGEIAYADSQLGRLFNKLRAEGLYDDALIIFTSDHGESLGEHGELTHSIFIYEATQWVPLFIKLPGNEQAGSRVKDLVRHIDLLPTQLDILGLGDGKEAPLTEDIQGISLLPLMEGGSLDPLVSYAESYLPYYYYKWAPPQSVQQGKFKYIHLPKPELYDLDNDRTELRNISPESRNEAERFSKILAELKEKLSEGKPAESNKKMDAETLAKLKSLGYIHGGAELTSVIPADPPLDDLPKSDPKDKIHIQSKITVIHALINQKDFQNAILQANQLLAEDPGNIQARSALASSFLKLGDVERAISVYQDIKKLDPTFLQAYLGLSNIYTKKKVNLELAKRELSAAFAISPQNPSLWVVKGDLEQEKGELEKAVASYKKAEELGDQSATLHVGLGSAYNKQDKLEEAKTLLERAIYIQNDYAEAQYNLGVVLNRMGDKQGALENYRLAISNDDTNPLFHTNLGSVLTELKQYPPAEQAFLKALSLDANHLEAVYNLGTVYLLTQRQTKAIKMLERAIAINPGLAFAYNNLAVAHGQLGQKRKALDVYKRLAKIAPQNPGPWLRMARLAVEMKRSKEAKKYLKTAQEKGGQQVTEAIQNDPLLKGLR